MRNNELSINLKPLPVVIFSLGLVAVAFFGGSLMVKKPVSEKNQAVDGQRVSEFLGEKGISVAGDEDFVYIDEKTVQDGNMKSFNYAPGGKGKTIYFFIFSQTLI